MNTFVQAIQSPMPTETTNGMQALSNTGNELTSLFFEIGSARNNQDGIKVQFAKAFGLDPLIATKILFWTRDIRGGAGERQTFRTLLNELEQMQQSVVLKNIKLIPEFGRWDDLFALKSNACRQAAFRLVTDTLMKQTDNFQLCAKWCPRRGLDAVQLRNFMKLSPKAYRKLLVHSTNVVETKMCAQEWTDINYNHVPSIAAKQYQRSFGKHDPDGYGVYREALKSNDGTAKINASSIFPHDVIHGIRNGDSVVGQAQWDALPNFLGDNYILPVVDVSGSMDCSVGKSNVTCLDIALSLGLYVANKQHGAFNKVFCTFSEVPSLQKLQNNDIVSQLREMSRAAWSMNTDVEKVFSLILDTGKQHNVSQDQMPKIILLLSDMQFDRCCEEPSDTAMSMISRMYTEAGYQVPSVVFWNINGGHGNAPVEFKEKGTALVSGFSPAILKSILKTENIDPYSVMMTTIGSDRYSGVTI